MISMSSKPSRPRVWSLGFLLAVVGVFVFTMAWSSTAEFWDIGAYGFFFLGIPLVLVTVLIASAVFLVIGWLIERRNLSSKSQRLLLLSPWILATAFWIASAGITAMPRSRFGATIGRPVPTSVQNIKAAGLNSFLARRWLLSFTLDPAQAGAIVSKHSLAQTNYFDFQAMVDQDAFFKRIPWAHNVGPNSNSLFYSRFETGMPSRWICFIVNTNSSRAWFMTGYQN